MVSIVFYNNYINLCNKVNKSPSAVAEEMGFKRSVVTAWKNGRMPRQATLQKIADYFHSEVDFLLSDYTLNNKTPATGSDGLSESQRELISLIATMTDAEVSVLVSTAEGLIASRKLRDAP
jgi:transcriptional regulator with XRE-family HTH domain